MFYWPSTRLAALLALAKDIRFINLHAHGASMPRYTALGGRLFYWAIMAWIMKRMFLYESCLSIPFCCIG